MAHKEATDEGRAAQEARKKALIAQAEGALDDLLEEVSAPEFERRMQARLALLSKLHRYSLHNQFLIASQLLSRGKEPTYVAGFRFWLGLNRVPRRGTGLYILRPTRRKEED